MSGYSIFLPAYSIGDNIYQKIGEICPNYGQKVVIIGGKIAMSKANTIIKEEISKAHLQLLAEVWYGGESSYENVEMLKKEPAITEADMIFAVGGGKCADTCKALAYFLDKPVFTFPTISSNCAPCTKVCIMYEEDGTIKESLYIPKPPTHCFINTKIIAEAPDQYLWAGIGDALSKEIETKFSAKGEELPHTPALGIQIGGICTEPLLKYGLKAMEASSNNTVSQELEEVVLDIIISTGLVSNMLNSDYNTNLAHGLYYAIAGRTGKSREFFHGELVAYGVLVLLLMDKQNQLFDRVYKLCKDIQLSTSLADLEITDQELKPLIEKTLKRSDIVHSPYQITYDLIYNAMMELEEYNK